MMEEGPILHLSDEQMTEALAGAAAADALAHFEECAACATELRRLKQAVGQTSAWSHAAAERQAGFWYEQRQAIFEKLGARRQPSRLAAWSAAVAALVLAAVTLTRVNEPALGTLRANAGNGAAQGSAHVDPDDALMAEIQASVRRPVPRAFEPALLVTQELHKAANEMQQSRQ
jgi:hypothetical protein